MPGSPPAGSDPASPLLADLSAAKDRVQEVAIVVRMILAYCAVLTVSPESESVEPVSWTDAPADSQHRNLAVRSS